MGWIEPKDMLPPKGLLVLLEISGKSVDKHGTFLTRDHGFAIGSWLEPVGEPEGRWNIHDGRDIFGLEVHAWMPLPKHFTRKELFKDYEDQMEHALFEDNPEWLYQGDNVYEQMTLEEFLGGANEKEQGVMQEM